MPHTADATGPLTAALDHTRRLLQVDPRLAVDQAAEILKVMPGHPIARLLLGAAQRSTGDLAGALATLERLASEQPNAGAAHYELGVTLADARQSARALEALRRAVALSPDMADAWRALGDQLIQCEDAPAADVAYARQIQASTKDPRLLAAASALCGNRIPEAEEMLKRHLWQHPTDVAAIRMLAEVAGRLGLYKDAENLLARCLELAPSFNAA